MNLKSFSKLAVVSALALGTAMYASGVTAATIGTPITVDFTANVVNTITVGVTDGTFGDIAAVRDTADQALLVMTPAGVITDDNGNGFGASDPAALVADPGSATAPSGAIIAVTNAFVNTPLYVTFDNCVDLALAGETILLDNITTDLATTTAHSCALAPGAFVASFENTDAAGALTFNIGASLQTPIAASYAPYTSGVYTGSVDMYISY